MLKTLQMTKREHMILHITKQLHAQTLEPALQEQLMFTQPEDPNNKKNLHIKDIVHIVTEQTTPSLLVSKKQRDEEDKRDAYARSKSPQKLFVRYFRSPSNDRTQNYDNRYRSPSTSRNNSYNKIDTVPHLEIDLVMTKVLLLHNTLDHDMILTSAIHGLTVLHRDLRIEIDSYRDGFSYDKGTTPPQYSRS